MCPAVPVRRSAKVPAPPAPRPHFGLRLLSLNSGCQICLCEPVSVLLLHPKASSLPALSEGGSSPLPSVPGVQLPSVLPAPASLLYCPVPPLPHTSEVPCGCEAVFPGCLYTAVLLFVHLSVLPARRPPSSSSAWKHGALLPLAAVLLPLRDAAAPDVLLPPGASAPGSAPLPDAPPPPVPRLSCAVPDGAAPPFLQVPDEAALPFPALPVLLSLRSLSLYLPLTAEYHQWKGARPSAAVPSVLPPSESSESGSQQMPEDLHPGSPSFSPRWRRSSAYHVQYHAGIFLCQKLEAPVPAVRAVLRRILPDYCAARLHPEHSSLLYPRQLLPSSGCLHSHPLQMMLVSHPRRFLRSSHSHLRQTQLSVLTDLHFHEVLLLPYQFPAVRPEPAHQLHPAHPRRFSFPPAYRLLLPALLPPELQKPCGYHPYQLFSLQKFPVLQCSDFSDAPPALPYALSPAPQSLFRFLP